MTTFSNRMRAMHLEAQEAIKVFMADREFYWLLPSYIEIQEADFSSVKIDHLPEFGCVIDTCYLVAIHKDADGNILLDGVTEGHRELIESITIDELGCEDLCGIIDGVTLMENSKSIEFNCAFDLIDNVIFEPFDEFEVHPVIIFNKGLDNEFLEQADTDEEADFFTVYIHLKEGGLSAIMDCKSRITAEKFTGCLEALLKAHSVN